MKQAEFQSIDSEHNTFLVICPFCRSYDCMVDMNLNQFDCRKCGAVKKVTCCYAEIEEKCENPGEGMLDNDEFQRRTLVTNMSNKLHDLETRVIELEAKVIELEEKRTKDILNKMQCY